MKRFVATGFAFALLVVAVGCSGSATTPPPAPALMKGEAEIKELIKLQTEMVEAAEKDPKKMMEYMPKMIAAGEKLDALKLSKEDQDKLKEKYKAETDKLEERMKKIKPPL